MELFGILCALPGALVASSMYLYVVRSVLGRPAVQRGVHRASLVVLAGVGLEWVALGLLGAIRIRGMLGPIYYPIHLALFILAVPAFANVLLIKNDGSLVEEWLPIAAFCAVLALPLVVTQYYVAEALYGVNGNSGPYGAP
jgi:hypothetical protein